jgi:hypothetical protein
MPKEVIYAASRPYDDESPARSVAEVRWHGEEGSVQLVTRCIRLSDHEVFIPEHVQKALTDAGLTHTQMAREVGVEVIFTAQDGWFIDLDRRAINKLIRDLRRARNAAFGPDE